MSVTCASECCAKKGDGDTCKTTAIVERRTTNRCYAIWDSDACKTTATRERRICNTGCTCFDYTFFNGSLCFNQAVADVEHFVLPIVCVIVVCSRRERIITNRCYAIWDGDACKTTATVERITTNRCYAIWNSDACKTTAIVERPTTNRCYTVRDVDACETGATRERKTTNRCYAIGNCDTCKIRKSERIITNRCYAVTNVSIFEIVAINFEWTLSIVFHRACA